MARGGGSENAGDRDHIPDPSTGRAVLLLHGFGDTPQTLHYVADALHAAGYTVRAPLLPGHGRTLAAFGATRAKQWISAARDAYANGRIMRILNRLQQRLKRQS